MITYESLQLKQNCTFFILHSDTELMFFQTQFYIHIYKKNPAIKFNLCKLPITVIAELILENFKYKNFKPLKFY